MTRYTATDVARKVELVNARLTAAGKPAMTVQSTNPDGSRRRYEFAGWVYLGAGEACRALDAMLYVMRALDGRDILGREVTPPEMYPGATYAEAVVATLNANTRIGREGDES